MPGRNGDQDVSVKCGRLWSLAIYCCLKYWSLAWSIETSIECSRWWSPAIYYYLKCWSFLISVRQRDLVKEVMVCGDVSMSMYKIWHPDDTDDPQDVGLSSDDEATGMGEEIGIARRVVRPVRSVSPSYSQGRAVSPPAEDRTPSSGTSGPSGEPPAGFVRLGPDEIVIKKAVLRGIKRGAELALKGCVPPSFSMGASAGDVPFAIPKPSRNEVHCTFCRKDFPSTKALRRHVRIHAGKSIYKCSRCGRHLASRATMEMHQRSCGIQDCPHNCVTCGKGYHSKQALLQHLKVHQPPASVEDRTCPDCKQVFNLVKTMREHRATHRGPFPCPVEDCPAVFSLPKRRNRHLREKHGFDSRRY